MAYDCVFNSVVFTVFVNEFEPLEPINSRILRVYDMLYPEYGVSWLDKLYITIGR